MAAPQQHEFKAEVAAVLRLVTRSLYTNREIFIRELISNASDALDKARFTALVDQQIEGQAIEPEVQITADKTRGLLIIEDSGIGMTSDEARTNLGTIAHSGTLKFLEEAAKTEAAKTDGEGKGSDLNLIGQFGVGFYSAFMVADQIDVYTRSAQPGSEGVHWSSTGDGSFTLSEAQKEGRGTRIEIKLKEDASEFLEHARVQHIVRRYSNYVMYPVLFKGIEAKDDSKSEDEQDKSESESESKSEPEFTKLNEVGAFWTRSPNDVSEEDYEGFYKHVMGGFVMPSDKPLGHLHLSMDAPIQFRSVLFIPGQRPPDLFNEDSRQLQLYARRVLVMENCDKLLPAYLRFMRGVVDTEDLPLNVSRELLQENKQLSAIRRQLTRKVLKLIEDLAKDDGDKFKKFYSEFGVFLKEGLHTEHGHRDQLTELLRFASTGDGTDLVSLRDYVDGMKTEQEAIYYITGSSLASVRDSPHLEACKARGYAVLLMTDPVDEWVVQDLHEYSDKPLRSVTQGDLGLDKKSDDEDADNKSDDAGGELKELIERAKTVLGDRVGDVRASSRLTQSASCLVDADGGMGRNMERILKMAGRDVSSGSRVLELNPGHRFVKAANTLANSEGDDNASQLASWIELLHDQAHLAEGAVPDPAGVVKRIQAMLDQLV